MAVPTRFGAYRNTVGGTYNGQVIGGVIMGVTASGAITESMSIMDGVVLADGKVADALPRERTSTGIYRAAKILSGGAFAYNAARAGTWVISRITTSLAGVANTKLLFMAQGAMNGKSIADFQHDLGVKMLNAWVNGRFSWTGKLANGTSKLSRTMWLSADGSAVAAPASLSTTFMYDLTDANATDKAYDQASKPTRSVPGELVMKADFVTAGLSGGNFFDYKPITGM